MAKTALNRCWCLAGAPGARPRAAGGPGRRSRRPHRGPYRPRSAPLAPWSPPRGPSSASPAPPAPAPHACIWHLRAWRHRRPAGRGGPAAAGRNPSPPPGRPFPGETGIGAARVTDSCRCCPAWPPRDGYWAPRFQP